MVPFHAEGPSLVGLGEVVMILELHRQGVSVSAIARQVGLDRKTVHKYIERAWSRRRMVRGRHGRARSRRSRAICANDLRRSRS